MNLISRLNTRADTSVDADCQMHKWMEVRQNHCLDRDPERPFLDPKLSLKYVKLVNNRIVTRDRCFLFLIFVSLFQMDPTYLGNN